MDSPALAPMQQSPPPLSGTWKLEAGRAMTLQPRENGLLRVLSGRVWVTCDGPHEGALNNRGDHILDCGDQIRLRAGKRWVIEAWTGAAPAHFNWVRGAGP
jgi:uncharacterized cupin superfamily protein